MKSKGNISIIRRSNAVGEGSIVIQVDDVLSTVQFLEVSINYEYFAQAITGLSCVPCEFTTRGWDKVGMKHEIKTESLLYDVCTPTQEMIDEELREHEINGWKAREKQFSNYHNWDMDKKCWRISFHRWVEAVE